ncbi:hypothetical protein A2U01_0031077, partial [Trifolium medium]|nr:hypothetical protein [Trifolium medium]
LRTFWHPVLLIPMALGGTANLI